MSSDEEKIRNSEYETVGRPRLVRSHSELNLHRSISIPEEKRRHSARYAPSRASNCTSSKCAKNGRNRRENEGCDHQFINLPRHVLGNRFWNRFSRVFRRDVRICVEGRGSDGISCSALYASEIPSVCKFYSPTQQIQGKPDRSWGNIVFQGSPFEIRVVGMQVAQFDKLIPAISGNELILFSKEKKSAHQHGKTPYIHFDFERDASNESHHPDKYIKIPDSKTYVAGYEGETSKTCSKHRGKSKKKTKKSVSIDMSILEIDKASHSMRKAISGIDQISNIVPVAGGAPLLSLINPSLGITKLLGGHALDHLSGPDPVMSIDVSFTLANKKRVYRNTAAPGKYLRYGYYFFLSEPQSAKLYASVGASEHVRLMVRRHQTKKILKKPCVKKRGEWIDQNFIPLAGLSYIVLRVSEPTGQSDGRHRYMQLADAAKLQSLFQRARLGEDPAVIQRRLIELGHGLGVFNSDSENEESSDERKCQTCIASQRKRTTLSCQGHNCICHHKCRCDAADIHLEDIEQLGSERKSKRMLADHSSSDTTNSSTPFTPSISKVKQNWSQKREKHCSKRCSGNHVKINKTRNSRQVPMLQNNRDQDSSHSSASDDSCSIWREYSVKQVQG